MPEIGNAFHDMPVPAEGELLEFFDHPLAAM